MNEIQEILSGQKAVNIKAGIAEEDMQKLAMYVGAAMFVAVLLANFITRK